MVAFTVRWAALSAVVAAAAAGQVPCRPAQGDEPAGVLLALRAAVAEGRFARAHAEAVRLGEPVEQAWVAAVFASLARPPAGWTFADDGHVESSGAQGPTMVRSLSRGEAATARVVVHTFRDEADKPHEANAPWFQFWQGREEAKNVPWAGRQALVVMERGEQGAKEVGIQLAQGCSLGIVAQGVGSAELVSAFGAAIDLALLERALDRGSPAGDASALAGTALLSFRDKRFASAFQALRLLREDLDGRCRERMADLLAGGPAGWTAAAAEGIPRGVKREWSRGGSERLSAYLAWEESPNVNGWLEALQDPAKRPPTQRVVEAGGRKVLVEDPRLDWEVRDRIHHVHVFFLDGNARLDLRSEGTAFEAGLAPLLAALELARIQERLAPLW